jgi:putative iron-regulated protein
MRQRILALSSGSTFFDTMKVTHHTTRFHRAATVALAAALLLPGGALLAQDAAAQAPAPALTPPAPRSLDEAKRMAVTSYAQIAEAVYQDALTQSIEMRKNIKDMVSTPTMYNHLMAKLGWLEARMPYLQTEVFRFSGGPVDRRAATLNAWPLDEGYIDYVEGAPTGGIISDAETYPKISPEVLEALSGAGGERNVATGFHAIEFLLWGQDTFPDSAGKRTHDDYKAEVTKHAGRRGLYLLACADLLVRQLSDVHTQWVAGKLGSYRDQFEKLPVDEALQKIFTGAGTLCGTELAAKNLAAVYETMEQDGEQSRFSDTTHIDMLHNTAGIANVVAGAYVGLDGKVKVLGVGLVGLADQVAPERGEKMRAAINAAMKAATAVRSPFDQEIVESNTEGRARVKALIDALNTLGGEIDGLAGELGLKTSAGG